MMSEGELVLVTGASGFIATHVVQQLQKAGYRVRGTVRSVKNETKVKPLRELCPDAAYPVELVEADLLKEQTWPAAVADCKYVLHTASPIPAENPADEMELIKPAVDGTLNVLKAVKAAKCVKRVVLTSSMASVMGGNVAQTGKTYTEEDWTDPDRKDLEAYPKSKVLAEKAAWDFVNAITDESEKFELCVINPGYVLGPVICGAMPTSGEIPKRLLLREMPMIPHMHMPCVDVRDVATAHVNAMTNPEAAGKRHALVSGGAWFKDVALFLNEEFAPQGYSIPLKEAPYFLLWILGRFDKTTRMLLPLLDKECRIDNSRMRNVLKISPITVKDSTIDMAYSMIELGMVKKTDKYKGPPSKK